MYCLRSNTKNIIASLLNLSLHFQRWCWPPRAFFVPVSTSFVIKTVPPTSMLKNCWHQRNRQKFCPDTCCKFCRVQKYFVLSFSTMLSCNTFGSWVLGGTRERGRGTPFCRVRTPTFFQVASSHPRCGFWQHPLLCSLFSLMFSLHYTLLHIDLVFFFFFFFTFGKSWAWFICSICIVSFSYFSSLIPSWRKTPHIFCCLHFLLSQGPISKRQSCS